MINVTHYKQINDPKSNVVALVNFYIDDWDLHLNGCRYIRKRNGGFFVAYPSDKKERENGEPSYYPWYAFGKRVHGRFQSSSQKAINEYIKRNSTVNNDE